MDVFPSGHDQGRSIITVTGDIDLASADDLRLGLDLSGVTYINSAGLRTLTAVHTRVSANGASFRLIRMSPVVVRFLELVNTIREPTPPASVALPVPNRPDRVDSRRAVACEHTVAAQYADAAA
ncbi:anti-anti-sigma factor [Catenulispora sp. GP43]|uniref:STAS domain-containing protein n=1 Tax=Catenulispora sp. GP43 TaxID=3156263 RepID=UPI0035166FB2